MGIFDFFKKKNKMDLNNTCDYRFITFNEPTEMIVAYNRTDDSLPEITSLMLAKRVLYDYNMSRTAYLCNGEVKDELISGAYILKPTGLKEFPIDRKTISIHIFNTFRANYHYSSTDTPILNTKPAYGSTEIKIRRMTAQDYDIPRNLIAYTTRDEFGTFGIDIMSYLGGKFALPKSEVWKIE